MTLVTLRPNGTIGNTGTVTGGSADSALADDNDTTYITYTDGQASRLSLDDLALPAGAIMRRVSLRVRTADVASAPSELSALVKTDATGGGVGGGEFTNVGGTLNTAWSSPATVTVGNEVSGWTDAAVDAGWLHLVFTDIYGMFPEVRVYEAYFDVRYVAKPVTSVVYPTGTVSDTNLPRVSWDNTLDVDGGAQQFYEVKVYTDAQYLAAGFNPDASTPTVHGGRKADGSYDSWGGSYWHVSQILPNDDYRVYVRVAQVVGNVKHWSTWASSDFTVNVALPAVPTIVPTAENTSGRITVDVTANAGPATTDAMELQRSIDDGVTWVPVRNQEGDTGWITGTLAMIHDYEAPNGSPTTYRARALHNYSGVWAASAWGEASTTWSADQWWIKHPHRPALNVPVGMFSYSEVTRGARRGVFQPLGASLPIVVADTRLGATGTITVQLFTTEIQDALDALLDTTATFLLQGPVAHGHPERWVRFGDHQSTRVVDKGWSHITREQLPWTLVAKPTGAQTGAQYAKGASVPGVPTITEVSAGDGEATVTFTAPANDGGAAIVEYEAVEDDGTVIGGEELVVG